MDAFFFKIVFFKIVFLKGQKALILVNTYSLINRFQDFKKQLTAPKKPFSRNLRSTKPTLEVRFNRRAKSKFRVFLATKKYPLKTPGRLVRGRDLGLRPRKGMFSMTRLKLISFNWSLERFLSHLLPFSIEVRLKNIFSLKKNVTCTQKSPVSLLGLCRAIYKRTKNF